MAMLMTSPMLIAVYWVAVLSVVGFLAAGAYIPLFRMYSDGCAQSQIVADDLVDGGVEVATGGGTPLARNTYSVAFNYATSQGNRDRLDGLERMEAERADACGRNYERSTSAQRDQQQTLSATVSFHERTVVDVELMRKCYNQAVLDASWDDPIEGPPKDKNGVAYEKVFSARALGNAQCDEKLSNSTLEDAEFDCDALDDRNQKDERVVCYIRCDDFADDQGRDNTPLKDWAIFTVCQVEYFAHGNLVKLALAIVVYAFVNAGRVLLVKGINRCLWSCLSAGLYAFIGTADVDGHPTFEEPDLADKIEAMLRFMRVKGLIMVAVAAGIQAVWVVAFSTILPELVMTATKPK